MEGLRAGVFITRDTAGQLYCCCSFPYLLWCNGDRSKVRATVVCYYQYHPGLSSYLLPYRKRMGKYFMQVCRENGLAIQARHLFSRLTLAELLKGKVH